MGKERKGRWRTVGKSGHSQDERRGEEEGEKREWQCLGLSKCSFLYSEHDTFSEKIAVQFLEGETWGCQLFWGRVQWRNRSTEESWVITGVSSEKSTLSLEKPWLLGGCDCGPHTHIPHILRAQNPGPSHELQQQQQNVIEWRVGVDEILRRCSLLVLGLY